MRKTLELGPKRCGAGNARAKFVPALLGEPQCQSPTIAGILGSLDEPGADQGIDRPAHGRCSAPDRLRHVVERRGFVRRDGLQQLTVRALASLGIRINSISDVTPVPHNGCRPQKRRRI